MTWSAAGLAVIGATLLVAQSAPPNQQEPAATFRSTADFSDASFKRREDFSQTSFEKGSQFARAARSTTRQASQESENQTIQYAIILSLLVGGALVIAYLIRLR